MAETQSPFDLLAQRFQIELYEAGLEREPDDITLLSALALALTEAGEYERGLDIDRRIIKLAPDDPTANYNLACSLSLTGKLEDAIDALVDAIECGYEDFAHLLKDPDLQAARDHDRFLDVLEVMEESETEEE